MGTGHSVDQLEVAIPSLPGEWILEANIDYCQLISNTYTHVMAEQYLIPTDHTLSLNRAYEIYDYRRTQNDNLVQVYQIERQSPAYICQGDDYLRVRTERIPKRLSDLSNISPEDALYIIQEALIGYRTIYTFQGPILINDDMIGFNEYGQVRVWLNNNFAKNTPDQELNPPRYEENTYHGSGAGIITNESGMATQVIDVVQEHVHQGQLADFLNTYSSVSPMSFNDALTFVKEYILTRGIRVPATLSGGAAVATETVVTVNQIHRPSMTKSFDAPLNSVTIHNFAPESRVINYQQLNTVTHPVVNVVGDRPIHINVIPATGIPISVAPVTVSPIPAYTPPSLIVSNKRANEIVHPISQIRAVPLQPSQNFAKPVQVQLPRQSVARIINEVKTLQPPKTLMPPPIQPSRISSVSSKEVVVNTSTLAPARRGISPLPVRTALLPRTSPSFIRDINQKPVSAQVVIAPLTRDVPEAKVEEVGQPHIASKKQDFRKETVVESKQSSEAVGRTLHNVVRVNSIGEAVQIPAGLVTNIQMKIEETKNEASEPKVQTQSRQEHHFPSFRGLPHRRSLETVSTRTVRQNMTSPLTEAKEANKPDSTPPLTPFSKLAEKEATTKSLFDFSQTIGQNRQTEVPTPTKIHANQVHPGQRQASGVQQRATPFTRPIQHPHQFPSTNYQQFHPGHVRRVEKNGDGVAIVTNLSGIQPMVNASSNITTFTNPLTEQKPVINQVIHAEVRNVILTDSAITENKSERSPKQENTILHELELPTIQDVPVAESQLAPTIPSQEQIRFTVPSQIITKPYQQPRIEVHAPSKVTKEDIWTSNDSIPSFGYGKAVRVAPPPTPAPVQVRVIQKTPQPPPQPPTQFLLKAEKESVDIESLMKRHNQENKELFDKYEEYGKTIQKIKTDTKTAPLDNFPLVSVSKPIEVVKNQGILKNHGGVDKPVKELVVTNMRTNQRHHSPIKESPPQHVVIQQGTVFPPKPIVIEKRNTDTRMDHQANFYEQITEYETIQTIPAYQFRAEHHLPQPAVKSSFNTETKGGYEYVTTEARPSSGHQVQEYSRGQKVINHKSPVVGNLGSIRESVESYNFQQGVAMAEVRGTAPTYEELRAALLDTNIAFGRDLDEGFIEYQNEYKYETEIYDAR